MTRRQGTKRTAIAADTGRRPGQAGPAAALVAGLGLVLAAGPAAASQHGNEWVHSRAFKGQVYVMFQDHMSLYTFDDDPPGQSTCTGDCARRWPPAILKAGTPLGEGYGLIRRPDGRMQATFRGKPLYLFSGDRRPGDTNGDGIDGKWRLARP